MFPSENNFFELLAYGKDKKQKKNIIKCINRSQINVLKNISKKILNGEIQLRNVAFRFLKNKKNFLRKLCEGKIKIKDLSREDTVVCFIVRLALEHNETRSKISSRTHRKVGKNRRQTFCKRSVSEVSSSEEYISSDESCNSSEESEIEEPERVRESSITEKESDVSFSTGGEEEESI